MAIILVNQELHYILTKGKDPCDAIKNKTIKKYIKRSISTENILNTIFKEHEDGSVTVLEKTVGEMDYEVQAGVKYLGTLRSYGLDGLNLSETDKEKIEENLKDKNTYPVFLDGDYTMEEYLEYGNYLKQVFDYKTSKFLTDQFSNNKAMEINIEACKAFAKKIDEIYENGDIVVINSIELSHLPRFIKEKSNVKVVFCFNIEIPAYSMLQTIPKAKYFMKSLLCSDSIEFANPMSLTNFKTCYSMNFSKVTEPSDYNIEDTLLFVNEKGFDGRVTKEIVENREFLDYLLAVRSYSKNKKLLVNIIDHITVDRFIQVLSCFSELCARGLNLTLVNLVTPDSSKNIENNVKINGIIKSLRLKYKVKIVNFFYYDNRTFLAHIKLADAIIYLNGRYCISPRILNIYNIAEAPLIVSNESKTMFDNWENIHMVNHLNIKELVEKVISSLDASIVTEKERPKSCGEYLSLQIESTVNGKLLKKKKEEPKKLDFEEIKKLIGNKKSTIITDYDGTLVPITKNFKDAVPSENLSTLLKGVGQKHDLIISTGRPLEFVEQYFKAFNAKVVAEHGSVEYSKGSHKVLVGDLSWMTLAKDVIDFFIERTPGLVLEPKKAAYAVHYADLNKIFANQVDLLVKTLIMELEGNNIRIIHGKDVIEVVSNEITKADMVKKSLTNGVVICAGDEDTDEDMFRVLKKNNENHISIKIGEGETSAKYRVPDVKTYLEFLESLA